MNPYKWNPNWAIDQSIDAQHAAFFSYFDEIFLVIKSGDHIRFLTLVTETAHFAEKHFATEELFMRELGYPGLQEHVKAHNEFLVKLVDHLVESPSIDNATEVLEFLIQHIHVADREFFAWMKAADSF